MGEANNKQETAGKRRANEADKPTAEKRKSGGEDMASTEKRKSGGEDKASTGKREKGGEDKASARKRGEGRKKASRRRRGDARAKGRGKRKKKRARGGAAVKRYLGRAGALNVCLIVGIALIVLMGLRQQRSYAEFQAMRRVVDRQTFYEGTTVEGVDVSRMTLSDAIAYWRDRVEPRYSERTVTLDNGQTVTSAELGYESDYASVLTAAWSAGRSGTLEERYRMAASRIENPVAFAVTRSDYSRDGLEKYVRGVAETVDRDPVDATIASFNTETYEFTFAEAQEGAKLDTDALKRDIVAALAAGGGGVRLVVEPVPPQYTTEEVSSQYGLIDYAITNASSSSRARLNNIKLAMSMINGTRVAPGETFSFNAAVGERTTARGFKRATAYSGGDVTEQVGGGICQVSTTLFNAAVKADMEIVERHHHSLTVSYVDKGKDATVNWGDQDLQFMNTSADDIYICCYLTEDKRVRFGIFGLLLPRGEKITLDAVTTEMTKYDTVYEASPLLASGETRVQQQGRNGYKAEAYKVRWDAAGNEISRELLCKSYYKMKSEIVLYGR